MLGERLVEELGQIVGQRVLPPENGAPVMEITYQGHGTLLDEQCTDTGTYRLAVQPNGTLYGEGNGVVMTESGAALTWKGSGVGHFTGNGTAQQWSGAIYYSTASPKFAQIAQCAAVFEYKIDDSGKIEGKTWEWK